MEDMKLIVAPSPHIRDTDRTEKIMFSVLIALLPVLVASIYLFRWDAVRLVLLSAGAAVATEAIFQRLRNKPSWMIIIGSAFAVAIGKQVFGGLGHNPFNPALVGRAFLTASFAVAMTNWTAPFDAISAATPLALGVARSNIPNLFFGTVAGSLGETSAVAILIGGIYLFYKGALDYRIPVGILGTVVAMSLLTGQDPVFHLLAGSVLFGAVFMATDPVTSPITVGGRWIFGIGIGLIIMLIRIWGSYPDGVTFAILLMNAATPLLNRWTRPRIYGQGVKASE